MRPRVLFILPSFAGGGAERVMITLLANLDPARFDARLLVLQAAGPLAARVPDRLPVTDLGTGRLRSALPRLRSALKRLAPSVVVSTMGYLNLGVLAVAATLPRPPAIMVREANTVQSTLAAGPSPWLTRAAYRWLYQRARLVLCNATPVREELLALGLDPNKVRLLPNPTDEAGLRAALKSDPANIPPSGGRRFLAVGRLTHQKGFDRLIDAAALAGPAVAIDVVGEGPLRADLERRAAEREVEGRVRFVGFDPDPWRRLPGATGLVMTSLWEGFPNVALEALACGARVYGLDDLPAMRALEDAAGSDSVRLCPDLAQLAQTLAVAPAIPWDPLPPSRLPARFRLDAVAQSFEALVREALLAAGG